MQMLSQRGQQAVTELATRYGLSADAVTHLLYAVAAGNGTMAQFNHPELGGSGQWMQGGMIMLGDMFNNSLKAIVDNLCRELAQLLNEQPFAAPPQTQWQNQGGYANSGWPGNLGFGGASASGSQNNLRYAYFAGAHRLAIDDNGQVSVYDTLDHQIGGVGQQQGSGSSLTFSSQYGTVFLSNLPLVSGPGVGGQYNPAPSYSQPAPVAAPNPTTATNPAQADILATLQKLADLHQQGILSDQEFNSKKADLLARL